MDEEQMIDIDISAEPDRPSINEFLNIKKKREKEQEDEEIFDINIITNYKNITPKQEDNADQVIDENNFSNNFEDNFSNFKTINREKYSLLDQGKLQTHEFKHDHEFKIGMLKNRKNNFNSLNFQRRTDENYANKRNAPEHRKNNKYSQFIKGKFTIYLCFIFLINNLFRNG